MNRRSQLTRIFLLVLGIACWSPCLADVTKTPLNQLMDIRHNGRAVNAGFEAFLWTERFIAPAFLPPAGSEYVLLPRRNKAPIDLAMLHYKVGHWRISIGQARSDFAIQVGYPEPRVRTLLGSEEIIKMAQRLFKDADNLEPIQNQMAGATAGAMKKRANQADYAGIQQLSWRQEPGRVVFHSVKDDGRPSQRTRMAGLIFNAYWFADSQADPVERPSDDIKMAGDWSIQRNSMLGLMTPGLIIFDLVRQSAYAVTAAKYLDEKYLPPSGLLPTAVPRTRNGTDLLRCRYGVDGKWITQSQSKSFLAVQIDGMRSPGKPILSRSEDPADILTVTQINDLAKKVFKGSETLVLIPQAAESRNGVAEIGPLTESPWLSRLSWWQENGRVVFYLPRMAVPAGGVSPDINGDTTWSVE